MQIPNEAVPLNFSWRKQQHKPLHEAAVLAAARGRDRSRGPMDSGKSSHLRTAKILRLSMDLPLVIEIVDSEEKIILSCRYSTK